MYELIDESGERKTGCLRHIGDWLDPLANSGVDLRPYVYDPEWGAVRDRSELLATGMDPDEVDGIMLASRDEFWDPHEILAVLHSAGNLVLKLIRHEGERTKVLGDLGEMRMACEEALRVGLRLQLLALSKDEEEAEGWDDDDDDA